MLISLIVPTINIVREIELFLGSVKKQNISLNRIEIIIVDQNIEDVLKDVLSKFSDSLNIRHIRTKTMGTSRARNIGITESKGEILGFPDDDCMYYPDTLSSVVDIFQRENPDICLGRLFDRVNNKPIIREWDSCNKKINKWNMYSHFSETAMFCKKNNIMFDENFGGGGKYYSTEGLDYATQAMKRKYNVVYRPEIEIWHPDQNLIFYSKEKIIQYGTGLGAYSKKHLSIFSLYLLLGGIFVQSYKIISDVIMLKFWSAKNRLYSLRGRICGFFGYSPI
jgi:glycosyltransferase involved in cell wall biosynthesis